MLGLVITLLFALGASGVGRILIGRLTRGLDPALAFGSEGLAGLAALGMLTLPVAVLPGGTHWGMYVVGVVSLAGYWPLGAGRPMFATPSGFRGIILLGALLALFCSAIWVLAPSTTLDWDTLAYHLAVPKMWIRDGQMHYISFIHQSNFPLTVDGLYIWGLDWGGESGAKAMSLCFAIYGAIAMFGFGRARFGEVGGWWSLLAYFAVPMVLWESGTAYIDVSNGLFVALGILFAAEYLSKPEEPHGGWLSAIFLGFAAGSKYTGLETIVVVAAVLATVSLAAKVGELRKIALFGLSAVLIASPWYVRNVINTGNPTFPFAYGAFHGKNWDAFSDQIYKDQQQTFGVGRADVGSYTDQPLEPARIGSAILGLAYTPGRYTDPSPTTGSGLPFVSLGAVPCIGLMVWLFSGRISRFEGTIAAVVLLHLAAWFVLSEQSRYILGLAFPLCLLAGGAVSRLRIGAFVAAAVAIQFLAGVFVFTRLGDAFTEKLRVVLGAEKAEDYVQKNVSFYSPAQDLNSLAKDGRVALYDEVFGYFLEVPYFWANPGHSTEMGYEQMTTSDQLVDAYHRLGITYVYINLGQTFAGSPDALSQWLKAESGGPYPADVWAGMMADPRNKYKVLLAEAIAAHRLTQVGGSERRPIYAVGP